ncbi:MAG TPA: SRPBCC domain-containing protein [Blastocatellia bacterium]|nr:SRPBCC domain-containing protein [Blastocatellia bacterium]
MKRIDLILYRAVAFLCVFAGLTLAEVADASAAGFTLRISEKIQAAPDEVYRKLTHNVGEWWSPRYTYSRDSSNVTLDDRPGGCFCEKLPDGGGVKYMEVVYAAPGKLLRMTGALGPFQPLAATGSMSIQLSPAAPGGTDLQVTYTVAGYESSGLDKRASLADTVIGDQFVRLKNYVEKGTPEPKDGAAIPSTRTPVK